jgi:hypothetical protein
MSAYERQARRDRGGINASNGANFIEDLSEKGRPLLRLWIWIVGQNRQRDLHREHAVGTKNPDFDLSAGQTCESTAPS